MNGKAESHIAYGKPRSLGGRVLRGCALGCAGMAVLFVLALILGVVLVRKRFPRSFPLAAHPVWPVAADADAGVQLPGFDSPYLGHTGSWDGKGGALFGASKVPDLDKERAMGLRWTFMPVYWRALEPNGPVDLTRQTPGAWQELDAFVLAAHNRGLNILMQAPVVGGNAGGPPRWAGRREPGKSAPAHMAALAAFAGKLARRYCPGGVLATKHGWGETYGVRAWELDNEPDGYLTSWKGQAADYAEFVTRAAATIKAVDPRALILGPAMASGPNGLAWLQDALNGPALAGSPAFRARGRPYSLGPAIDVVSFHCYEGLDSLFSREPRAIGRVVDGLSAVFNRWEQRVPGFTYKRKQEYWHTEGDFDFLGILPADKRAAWRFQFFTRAFAAGVRKVNVMGASPPEALAIRTYVRVLPNPFPMLLASDRVTAAQGQVLAFRHPDGASARDGQVWVLWATVETGQVQVKVPARQRQVQLVRVDGSTERLHPTSGQVSVPLLGDKTMPAPVLLIDRPGPD